MLIYTRSNRLANGFTLKFEDVDVPSLAVLQAEQGTFPLDKLRYGTSLGPLLKARALGNTPEEL